MTKTADGDFPTNQTCCYIPHSLPMDDSSYGKHKENELLSWYLKFCSSRINLKFARICLNVYAEVNWIFQIRFLLQIYYQLSLVLYHQAHVQKHCKSLFFLKREGGYVSPTKVTEVYFAMECIYFLLFVAGILFTQNTAKIISLHRNTAPSACDLSITVLKWAHPHW